MKPFRLLVVEDESIVAMDIEERLVAMGYEIAGRATTAEQALAVAGDQRPDLVLMDIRLQGSMDGISAAQEIRGKLHLPVIFLTAYSEDDTLERAKVAEPYGYLLKPMEDRELKSVVEIALHKHQAEKEILRLSTLYNVLSQVNQAVVRSQSREEFLPLVCRLIVERGAVDLAWIGCLDRETSRINPVAHFGTRDEILRETAYYADDRPGAQGNPGRAIREEKLLVCNDCIGPGCPYTSKNTPAELGFRSCASFPIRYQGTICGALSLCTSEVGFFREREVNLLEEVAADISFALDKIENDKRRKQAETALRSSEAKFRSYIEHAPIAVLVTDRSGRFVEINPAATTMLGYTESELLKMSIPDVHTPEWVDAGLQRFQELVERASAAVEFPLRRKDNKLVWVYIRAVKLDNDRFLAFCEDITELKHAEESIREREGLLRLFVEHAPASLAMFDREMRYVNASRRWLTDYKLKEVDLTGLSHYDIFPEIPERWKETHRRALSGEVIRAEEDLFERSDGSAQWLRWEVRPWYGHAGDVAGILIFSEDITERKKLDETLRESAERYRSLVETTYDWVWEMGTDGKYTYASPRVEQILGYTPEEILGQTPFDLMPEKEALRLREAFTVIVARRGSFSLLENVNLHKSGREVILETSGAPIFGPKGEWAGYQGIDRDITERKNLEVQFRQAQKMEAIGQLAGGVAHDFNNLLTVIAGFGTLIQMATEGKEELQEYVSQILGASERASHLTESLLAFSRKQQITLAPHALNDIVQSTGKLLKRLLTEDIALHMNLTPQSPVVMVDRNQIDHALINLATNARDAMPGGGSLTILTEVVSVDEEFGKTHGFDRPGKYVKLSLSDTGAGMDEQTLEHIFEPFFTTKEVGKGTGLGLASVYGTVRQHGGHIEARSEVNRGTTIDVYLPLIEKQEPEKASSPEKPMGGKETILVVEDDPSVRFFTCQALSIYGYTALEAVDGQDAIEVFRNNKDRVDLILMDVVMPGKNGREAYEAIRGIGGNVKVIFASGYPRDIMRDKGIQNESVDFISKPLSPTALLNKVREVLDR
jgi:two-component system, cell cycle sensor histidine kinase and response regulator CckA